MFLRNYATLRYGVTSRNFHALGDMRKRYFLKIIARIIDEAEQFRELAAKQN